MSTKQDNSTTFDPSRRRLCPDGSCVGLLGTDGVCKVCGTHDSGRTGPIPAASPPALPDPEPEIDDEAGAPTASDAEQAFDPKRRLCSDEACVGVVGSDNKCSVCGRPG